MESTFCNLSVSQEDLNKNQEKFSLGKKTNNVRDKKWAPKQIFQIKLFSQWKFRYSYNKYKFIHANKGNKSFTFLNKKKSHITFCVTFAIFQVEFWFALLTSNWIMRFILKMISFKFKWHTKKNMITNNPHGMFMFSIKNSIFI